MSVSIIEALQNADHNLSFNGSLGLFIAKEQLHNATVLLEKGYGVQTHIEPLLEKYGNIKDVPKQSNTPGIKNLLTKWEQYKKANWWESECVDVEELLMERFINM